MTLIIRTTLFIGVVEDIEAVVINVIADKDISDEFQDRRLSGTRFANKKDDAWFFDDPLFERLNVLENTVRSDASTMCRVLLDVIPAIVSQRVLLCAIENDSGRDLVWMG